MLMSTQILIVHPACRRICGSKLASVFLAVGLLPAICCRADTVTECNTVLRQAVHATPDRPATAGRKAAIVQLAVYDAVNGIGRKYPPYLVTARAPEDARQEAAAAQTAHTALMDSGNSGGDDEVTGGWYVTVNITSPITSTFDATYTFGKGGAFTRIDGRNNAPAAGTWKRLENGDIAISAILFNFVNGTRNGAIYGKFLLRVQDGVMNGTFVADGILGLNNFHREGNFAGTKILAGDP